MGNWLNINGANTDKLIVSILVDKYLVDFGFIKKKFSSNITMSDNMKSPQSDSCVLLYYLDGCNGVLCIDNEYIYLLSKNIDDTFSVCSNVKYLSEYRYDFGKFEYLIEQLLSANFKYSK